MEHLLLQLGKGGSGGKVVFLFPFSFLSLCFVDDDSDRFHLRSTCIPSASQAKQRLPVSASKQTLSSSYQTLSYDAQIHGLSGMLCINFPSSS